MYVRQVPIVHVCEASPYSACMWGKSLQCMYVRQVPIVHLCEVSSYSACMWGVLICEGDFWGCNLGVSGVLSHAE